MTEAEGITAADMSPEREAHYLIRKIRRQVRLLNRKWAEINQSCNEWQSQIDEVLEVSKYGFSFVNMLVWY